MDSAAGAEPDSGCRTRRQARNFNAIWNGQTLVSLTNAAQSGYTHYTYAVTATGSTSTLEISARNDPSQWDLDNISLSPLAVTKMEQGPPRTIRTAPYQTAYAGVAGLGDSSYENVYNTAGALVADAQDMTNGSETCSSPPMAWQFRRPQDS